MKSAAVTLSPSACTWDDRMGAKSGESTPSSFCMGALVKPSL
jgi:hypothetical protein